MLRPNLGMDAPPTSIKVGGVDYPCNTDYRIWIEVLEKLKTDMYEHADGITDLIHNMETLQDIQFLVFNGVIESANPADIFAAILSFARGYPSAENQSQCSNDDEETDAIPYDFGRDLNLIILAIRDQTGIDLSYRRKEPFHWWEFLLEFKNLQECHRISKIMQIRTYKGDDRDMKKARAQYALDADMTMDEKREFAELEAAFGGCE